MNDFEEFPKIPRLSRDVVITEKIGYWFRLNRGLLQVRSRENRPVVAYPDEAERRQPDRL